MKITPSRKVTRISLVSPLLARSDLHERSRISLAQLFLWKKLFFVCFFLNLFIHSYFYMKTNFTYHLFASS